MWRWLFLIIAFQIGAAELKQETQSPTEIDIAIIGAGINGCYIGSRLNVAENTETPPLNVHLFEATNRIGGRLYTVFFPGMENIPVELGGMRFKDTHKNVLKLVNELGLKIAPFIRGTPDNLVYIRNVRLRKSELNNATKLPYRLEGRERGKTPEELMAMAVSRILPNFDKMPREEWIAKRDWLTYEGKLLKDVSWINFLSSQFSPEAFQFLVDINEIYLTADTSALNQLDQMVGTTPAKWLKFVEGYQAVPVKLSEKFQRQHGTIHLEHSLISIVRVTNPEGKASYELTFVEESGEKVRYVANKVILTISPTALLHLLPNTPFAGNESLINDIKTVTPHDLTKFFLAYRNPWWRSLKLTEGNSITDLPLRRCYYFPSVADFEQEPTNQNALLLASYQGAFVPFWRSLNASRPFSANTDGLITDPLIVGSDAVIQVQHQLKLLHGLDAIPEPYAAAFQDWGRAPFYAAFYYWNAGVNPRDVERAIRKPDRGEEIYIFSSDFSEQQGWVEPLLESTDRLLKQYFNIGSAL